MVSQYSNFIKKSNNKLSKNIYMKDISEYRLKGGQVIRYIPKKIDKRKIFINQFKINRDDYKKTNVKKRSFRYEIKH